MASIANIEVSKYIDRDRFSLEFNVYRHGKKSSPPQSTHIKYNYSILPFQSGQYAERI